MRFTKMNGAGNDFIIVENLRGELDEQKLSKLARTLCDRRMSIGADGLMAVVPAKGTADYGMLFFNCDGFAWRNVRQRRALHLPLRL